ncbi:hypothetical protein GH714_043150 [Hevea brasiliensis]|uniref:Disease resistance protein At4g27190-like leucine-rich repeats domain-containing protein n=1 Tax=Hevea brasiliensis TaxID=3981 RepID=A0A6A6K298_HEVBR|nr:hypothetical protein GH714_043150 [Hevea brasiliensis]
MLTRLLIHCKKILRRIENGQQSECDLSNVRVLEVENCENLVNLIPFNLIECLQKLEKLIVCRCGSLMEMFECQGTNTDVGYFVTFSHLEEVQLSDLPKLMNIFTKIPENVIGFRKLRKLQVHICASLRNIFSVFVAKGLVQLHELDIESCYMLEEIIVAKEDEQEEEEASKEKIVFPQLRSLQLRSLPNLKCFYSGIYALEFPLLEKLKFCACNGMKTFSYGSLSMPKLKELKINYAYHQLMGSPDLNATMSQLFSMKKRGDQLYLKEDESDVFEKAGAEELLQVLQDSQLRAEEKSGFCIYKCDKGDGCQFLHSWFYGDWFSTLAKLKGHIQAVSGIALPSRSDKLFSGSSDGIVHVWDCYTGQSTRVINLGIKIGTLISEGPWIFVGLPNIVKEWNIETAVEFNLDGLVGQVNAIAVVDVIDMLFARA